ncbi:putative sexual development activator [Phaeomoniella chlamydospora]|uniref:Putative sexual development activator n=1 Tax=Phaeomoniella chlamydospora TaxID=158046 RepID=A0A0G2EQ49_PHACM|nr:putative sexual development activator [Phaeomoniella chlamydospora]
MDKLTLWANATNVTTAKSSRRTVDGRRLTYQLHVLQQPERARACGNGAKASADRRPVDPPPVVELRVFEGEDDNNLKDITISFHNVNFFLFATLEARPIATGRVAAPGPPSLACLSGCNVAGINYLERPSPAGYFIFPDLSVRHEGFYRLTFGLYEQVKDWRDADPDRPFPKPGAVNGLDKDGERPPEMHNASVQRLEVRSEEFQVYSAKKFPGLDRSTGLSIGLSDQGCRVRIRRDVRMRKRPKPKPMNDQYGDDALRGRYATPEGMPMSDDRQRSLSHSSRDGTVYGERRLSVHTPDAYGSQPPPTLASSAPLSGPSFAVPTTPSSALPQSASYHQHHYASPVALPSPVIPGSNGRAPDFPANQSPYRPYERRGTEAAPAYNPDVANRRPSESSAYSRRSSDAPSYHRASDVSAYRPSEAYRPQENSNYPAHYSYPSGNKVTIAAEQPMLPPVSDLIRDTDMRQDALQAGKRSYSPPRYGSQSLKGGMRPSNPDPYEESYSSFSGMLEYKRANGGLSHAPLERRY